MLEPEPDDVEETVPPNYGEEIAIGVAAMVAVAMTAVGLACFIISVLSRFFDKFLLPPCFIITNYPTLWIPMPWVVLAVALCLKKLRAASRTGATGDREDESIDEATKPLSIESYDVGGHRMVPPPMQLQEVAIFPISSSQPVGGVCWAGGNVASAADVQVGGESHHRSEREKG